MTAKTKIVLYNPRGSTFLPYDGPPMAILMVASLLDLERYDIKILDWHYDNVLQRLAEECKDAAIFGVTTLTGYQIKGMIESTEIARKANPNIQIVCGGWHPTFMPEQTFQAPCVDYVVIGQGPRPFKELVEHLEQKLPLDDIPGLAFRTPDGIHINPPREIEPIDHFPPIPYHLLEDPSKFLVSTKFGNRVAYLLSSQGCPHACGFCSESSFYKRRWTVLPLDIIRAQIIEYKEKYNIDGVILSDSNFFANEKRVADFCRMIMELGVKWGGVAARPDSLSRYREETWQLMKDSGLGGVFIGTESANNDTLKRMNKECTIEHTIKAIQMAKKYDLWIEVPFIIGIPGSDIEEDFRINMKFVNDHRHEASQFHMFMYTPFPGTMLIKEAVKLGYVMPDKLEGWIDYALHTEGLIPWVPAKWAGITDQLAVYFQFLAGNPPKVIKQMLPKALQPPALLLERLFYHLSAFRIRHAFMRFPIEYKLMKFVVHHRDRLFGKKNLIY